MAVIPTSDHDRLIRRMLENRFNAEVLARLPRLGLSQSFLTAGCLFQTLWNQTAGRSPEVGIRDYDVFYFDDTDLSWAAEDQAIRQARMLFADLGIVVELRNQARVHRWYERRFGSPCQPLASPCEAIDRFLVACCCIGIEAATGKLYVSGDLAELQAGLLRRNPRTPQPALFRAKAEDYRSRCAFLTILD